MSELDGMGLSKRVFPDFDPSDAIITSARILRLADYWRDRCQGRPVPLRADIDPADIKELLPNILLTEIEQPFRVRYRLVGTKVVEFNRLDFTGSYLDDTRWDSAGRYSRAYRQVVATQRPHFGIDSWLLAGAEDGRSEIVILPLSSDGSRIDRCLAMEDFLFSSYDLAQDGNR